MGVRRAVDMALEAAAANNIVYTLGPLIHNKKVLDGLKSKGIGILAEGEKPSPASTVIIRAHGVAPLTEKEFAVQGINIIDATCPNVKANQKRAYEFAQRGYKVFLAGEKDHGEIIGIKGYAEGPADSSCYVIADPEEAESAGEELSRVDPAAKTVLLGQTTLSRNEYNAIGEKIKKYFPGTEIINTICGAVSERQESLMELAGLVDAVIVAGSRDSANTRRLFYLARELGKPAWLMETGEDLPFGINKYRTIGLAAGASAPDSLIDEIEEALYNSK